MLEAAGPDALPVLAPVLRQSALAHEERAVPHERGAAGVAHDEVGVVVDRLVRAVVLDRLVGQLRASFFACLASRASMICAGVALVHHAPSRARITTSIHSARLPGASSISHNSLLLD